MKRRVIALSLAALLSVVSATATAPTVDAKQRCPDNPGGQQIGGAAPQHNPHCLK